MNLARSRARRTLGGIAACALWAGTAPAQQQIVDPDFDVRLDRPAFRAGGPTVVVDEAHGNFHTASGQYRPFADLLRADGFRVVAGKDAFSAASLRGMRLLIIANPGSPNGADTDKPAFTEAEAEAVRKWVKSGGALLLIADHAPFGLAAAPLARRLGVAMGRGWVFEKAPSADGITTQLTFSRANHRLGSHPITNGRSSAEKLGLVKSFTGQSLSGPPGSVALLRLDPDAREAPDRTRLDRSSEAVLAAKGGAVAWPAGVPRVGERAQGLAFRFGRGRVVVLGEAAMLSAQVIRFRPAVDREDLRVGMGAPGNDNRQFALNVMHWLAGVLR
ncbi:MAG: DUF4350 domain-containing protein [Alphaproteobacteria bacterium]|nr:DUF4350 domain-containing protein [Alphaproteobacteria bacterium]MBV9372341.1 DUF4350 domain-containing protein [Alphaproteobacteria bacterium]MBV9899633.1 DUF4350 domain-containing protein [Alphaproteobacteria bacterium]